MKKLIIILLIGLLSTSCLTVRRIQNNCDKFAAVCLTGTEVESEIRWRDTTIYVDIPVEVKLPPDTVRIEKPIPCPEPINIRAVRKENGLVGVTARVDNSVLFVTGYLTDSTLVTRLQDSIRILNAIKQEVIKETNTVTVREDTNFGKFAKKWFLGSIIIIMLFLTYIILKKK